MDARHLHLEIHKGVVARFDPCRRLRLGGGEANGTIINLQNWLQRERSRSNRMLR
jgi:hypothetical protein